MRVSSSDAATIKQAVDSQKASDAKTTHTKTKAEIQKHEEDRWLKPQIKGDGAKVDASKSLSDASPESMAYATKIFSKLTEQDPAKGELFMKTLVENLFKIKGTDKRDALRISSDNALKSMVQSGVITPANAEALHDGGVKEAHDLKQDSSVDATLKHKRSTASINTRSVSTSAESQSAAAPSGFLWKPVSDSTGKLAILLPPSWSKKANTSVEVLDPNGNSLGKGAFGGNGNGDRDHFRFDKPGSAFPEGSYVKVIEGGETHAIQIENPSSRIEGK